MVQAAWFQQGVGPLGQRQVGLEHPFQRGLLRRSRLFCVQALAAVDAQQVVEAVAQLPGLVLPGCLHQLGVDQALQQPLGLRRLDVQQGGGHPGREARRSQQAEQAEQPTLLLPSPW